MSELAEGARLEIACTTNVVPRVRIPLSPPFINLCRWRRLSPHSLPLPFVPWRFSTPPIGPHLLDSEVDVGWMSRSRMTYEVLARKWRPQRFQDVIGQAHVTQTLMNAIKSDRLAHAYLFSGPRGVGKTSVARILAKAMNCKQGELANPCNSCRSCLEITEGSSVDVQEIDGASNRGIDEIRELRENIRYMPSSSSYRIYIIDEVHMLTLQAFNALLKTLEEPPAHVKFIFATTEAHKVPVTILSRCQRFDFKRIPLVEIVSHLESITRKEGIEINKSGLALIGREAQGSMRDAESLLDQVVSFAGDKITDKNITDILGIIDRDIIFDASRAIIEGASGRCLEIVDQIYNYGYDIKEFYRALMGQFRNLLISQLAAQDQLLDMTESDRAEAASQAEKAGPEKLQVLLNFLINREEDLRFSSQPRLILETTMIKLSQLGEFLSFDDLLKKIEGLEDRILSSLHAEGVARISDPGIGWDSDPDREVETGVNDEAQSVQDWEGFLKFLSSKNRAMYIMLKDWQFSKLTEKTLEITKSSQPFSSAYFDEQGHRDQLVEYCREFFERDVALKILENNQVPLPKKKLSRAGSPEPGLSRPLDLPPTVQDILHVFQGKIEEGSSLKGSVGTNSRAGKKEEEVDNT